jgi:dienelactone hydrolase
MRSIIAAGFAMTLVTGAATAQPLTAASTGTFTFDAPTYAHYGAFRAGEAMAGKASVTIWLPAMPAAAAREGRIAAVMIAHSIGGWKDASEGVYVRPLLAAGYAVFGLDHFGPRGIKRAADVPGAISPITPVSDALLALKLVAAHPAIDPARIGIMGLSMGGITSELSAYEYVRHKVLGDAAHAGRPLRFAAHVPFYAPCGNIFSNDSGPMTTGAPMLKLYGGRDETTPREKCDRIDALVRAAQPGLDWQVHWYPEAYHAWENPAIRPAFHAGHVNARKCPVMDFGSSMRFIDRDGTVRPFNGPEVQTCINDSTGYSMGYSPEAAEDAPKRMLAFFAQHLKP